MSESQSNQIGKRKKEECSGSEKEEEDDDTDRKPSAVKRARKKSDDVELETDKADETLRSGLVAAKDEEEPAESSHQPHFPAFQSGRTTDTAGIARPVELSASVVPGDQRTPTGAESLASLFPAPMNSQLQQLDPSLRQISSQGTLAQVAHLQALSRMLSSLSTQHGLPTSQPQPPQTRADHVFNRASDDATLILARQLHALQSLRLAQISQLLGHSYPSGSQVPQSLPVDSRTLQALNTLLVAQQSHTSMLGWQPQDPSSTMMNALLLSMNAPRQQQTLSQPPNVTGISHAAASAGMPPSLGQVNPHLELLQQTSMGQVAPAASGSTETIEAKGSGSSSNSDLGLEFTGRPPVLLYIPDDEQSLSEFQCLVRKQIELLEADEEMVERHAQGRNKPIFLGQVGIRCRHCTSLPQPHRARGAVFFPSKARGIYQAAQNMANTHLTDHCQHIPNDLKEHILRLQSRKSSAGGGKKYWEAGLKVHGVFEDSDGLRFERR